MAMKIDCSKLFPNSHLHLLVWPRLDPVAHESGLRFVLDLTNDADLEGNVMPLLRPNGRQPADYAAFDACASDCEGFLPWGPPDERLPCCEMWFQVTSQAEEALWREIQEWRQGHSSSYIKWSKAWRSKCKPDWQPLSVSRESCDDNCETSPFFKVPKEPRFLYAKQVLAAVGDAKAHWLLKTIWYRATETMSKHAAGGAGIGLDPLERKQGETILQHLEEILSSFDLADYRIPRSGNIIDPSAFAVSHMPAYAINALLPVNGGCPPLLERYLQDGSVTHPYFCPSLNEYLAFVRTLMDRRWQ